MAARFALVLVVPLALSVAGCASQYGGAYATGNASSLGGPRHVRVADAAPRYDPASVQPRYVYRGGRDPVTGRAYIQEGRGATR